LFPASQKFSNSLHFQCGFIQLSNGSRRAADLCAEVERIREERELRQFFATLDELMEGNASQQKKAFDMLKRREHNVRLETNGKELFLGGYYKIFVKGNTKKYYIFYLGYILHWSQITIADVVRSQT